MEYAGAKIDITPAAPVFLAGFAQRQTRVSTIVSRLEASVMVFRDQTGRTSVLVTVDLLYAGSPIIEAVQSVCRDFGVRSEDITIAASHTHYAPATDPTKSKIGQVDEHYLSFAVSAIASLVSDTVKGPTQSICIGQAKGDIRGNVNRRFYWPLPTWRAGKLHRPQPLMASNIQAKRDETGTVVVICDVHNEVIGAVVHWACHPTAFPDPHVISAEYIGSAREALRIRYGRAIPVAYLQGFCGDLRPDVPSQPRSLLSAARRLLTGPTSESFNAIDYKKWNDHINTKITDLATEAQQHLTTASGNIVGATVALPLAEIVTSELSNRKVTLTRQKIGNVLEFVAVSAEPVIELLDHVPYESALKVGYSGDVFGYWPTDEQVRDGGYEAGDFMHALDIKGHFNPRLDQIFLSAMRDLERLS